MKKSRFAGAQIIGVLREQEAGETTDEVCRRHRISPPTFYRWKAKAWRPRGVGCVEERLRRELQRPAARRAPERGSLRQPLPGAHPHRALAAGPQPRPTPLGPRWPHTRRGSQAPRGRSATETRYQPKGLSHRERKGAGQKGIPAAAPKACHQRSRLRCARDRRRAQTGRADSLCRGPARLSANA